MIATRAMKPEPIYCCPCHATTRHVPSPEGKREELCVVCGTGVPIYTRAAFGRPVPKTPTL
jgi:hypothetical protein